MKKNLPRWKLHLSPARPARTLWGVPDGPSAGIKIKFSLICKNFNLLNFKMNHLKTDSAFLVAFEMFVWLLTILLLEISHFLPDVILHMSSSDWWLKLSNFKKSTYCYCGVFDRRLAAMWLCFVFASPLLSRGVVVTSRAGCHLPWKESQVWAAAV